MFGQFIYVSPSRQVVIAMNANETQFDDPGVYEEDIEMFRRIASLVS